MTRTAILETLLKELVEAKLLEEILDNPKDPYVIVGSTADLLNKLYDIRQRQQQANTNYEEYVRSTVPQQFLAAVDAANADRQADLEALEKVATRLVNAIKADVVRLGSSVAAEFLLAKYAAGKRIWDVDGLETYAKTHKEIEAYRKISKPSVTIEEIKK